MAVTVDLDPVYLSLKLALATTCILLIVGVPLAAWLAKKTQCLVRAGERYRHSSFGVASLCARVLYFGGFGTRRSHWENYRSSWLGNAQLYLYRASDWLGNLFSSIYGSTRCDSFRGDRG